MRKAVAMKGNAQGSIPARLGTIGIGHVLARAALTIFIAVAGLAIWRIGRLIELGDRNLIAALEPLLPLNTSLALSAFWWSASALLIWVSAEMTSRRPGFKVAHIIFAILFGAFVGHAAFAWFGVAHLEAAAAPLSASATLIAFVAHYWRFRLPFTAFPVAVGGWLLIIGLVSICARHLTGRSFGEDGALIPSVTFLYGCALFALALRLDRLAASSEATTSDAAFWLHLLAAPLIAIPVIAPLLDTVRVAPVSLPGASTIGAAVLIFVAISLLANRAALAGAALGYPLSILGIQQFHGQSLPLGAFAVGAGLIEVAALALLFLWHPLRGRMLGLLPAPWANWYAPHILKGHDKLLSP